MRRHRTLHNNKNVSLHLSLPMWKIRQERDITAKLIRALKHMSNRKAIATLDLATVMLDERDEQTNESS